MKVSTMKDGTLEEGADTGAGSVAPEVATAPLIQTTSTGGRATTAQKVSAPRKRNGGHAKPLPILLDLSQPGRLRIGHLMTLFGLSHASVHKRLRDGGLPRADGKDGRRSYWKTSTVRALLEG